jgi:hypothetical protein
MVLFNEYIPLQRREPKPADKVVDSLSKSMNSLAVSPESEPSGIFLKSEPAPKQNVAKQEGVFLRSVSPDAVADDWVIA